MSEAKWSLVPLTPEYIENEHGDYVAELENALKNHEIRNIALSGPYGVGKKQHPSRACQETKGPRRGAFARSSQRFPSKSPYS